MDTNNKNQQDPNAIPQQPAVQTNHQSVSPISSGHKEHAPIGGRASEHLQASPVESAPAIPTEVAEYVSESPDSFRPDVPADAKQVGVTPVKTAVPVPTKLSDTPVLPTPMTYQQAVTNLKSHKANESITWLSMLSKYILAKLGMQHAN